LVQSQAGAPAGVRLNFVDAPPPQEAFNTDVAALREADAALAVIDIVEGSSSAILTCGKLRQCLSQARSIKPVMVLTKLDRAFLELQLVNLQTAHAHPTHDAHTRHRTHTHHTADRGGRGAMA
jgi:translation elongation factor EF-G